MIKEDILILAQREPWRGGVSLLAASKDFSVIAESIVLTKKERGDDFVSLEPTITISETAAQRLIDELWNCGLRPSEGSGSAGMLKATQNHLEDMRTLVFKRRK